MTKQLPPAAQVVLDAYSAIQWQPGEGHHVQRIVAALRAAAEQVKPDLYRTPWITNEDGYFNETFENMEALGEMNAYYKLLAIAAELERPMTELCRQPDDQ